MYYVVRSINLSKPLRIRKEDILQSRRKQCVLGLFPPPILWQEYKQNLQKFWIFQKEYKSTKIIFLLYLLYVNIFRLASFDYYFSDFRNFLRLCSDVFVGSQISPSNKGSAQMSHFYTKPSKNIKISGTLVMFALLSYEFF